MRPRTNALIALALALSVWAQERGLNVSKSSGGVSEKRFALVIGNGEYSNSRLLNPGNDARDIAGALAALGFEVIHKDDLSQTQMKQAIREFGSKIRNGGVGLFYYAGHGVQVNGKNYLIPVGATINSEYEVEYESVDVGFLLAQMEEARNRLNIVILDACRNNPFAKSFRSASHGLASIDAPSGTIIAYATAPGSVASDGESSNGLYTQELLGAMRIPGLKIEEVFKRVRIAVQSKTAGKQIPWESSSLVGEFSFAEGNVDPATESRPGSGGDSNAAGTAANSPNRTSVDPAALELSFWESIKNSSDPEDFKSYLEKYPNGQFAGLARRRIRAPANLAANKTSEEAGIHTVAELGGLGSSKYTLGKFGEAINEVTQTGPCQIKLLERVLWNSKSRYKPTITELIMPLQDINIASIGVVELQFPDRPSSWAVTVRPLQGRTFTFLITGYENRQMDKVKIPTKTVNVGSGYAGFFADYDPANRYAKALAGAARSCGAKSETF